MSYSLFLALHSANRWLITICLLTLLIRTYVGWKKGIVFSKTDQWLKVITLLSLYFQLILGINLYFDSPIVQYFLENIKESLKLRQVRFFGLEHITMMTLGVILITIGFLKAQKHNNNTEKFRIIFIYTAWAVFVIFTSIPWEFSPLTSRPSFRAF